MIIIVRADITVIERSLEEVIRAEKTDKNESQHQDQSHDIGKIGVIIKRINS